MKMVWCAAWGALWAVVASAADEDDPIAFLKSHDAEVQAILAGAPADSLPPARREELKKHINAAFDFRELSRLALGEHWEKRSPAERDHFAETFSSIIREQNFASFSRYYREGEIRYEVPRCAEIPPSSRRWRRCGASK